MVHRRASRRGKDCAGVYRHAQPYRRQRLWLIPTWQRTCRKGIQHSRASCKHRQLTHTTKRARGRQPYLHPSCSFYFTLLSMIAFWKLEYNRQRNHQTKSERIIKMRQDWHSWDSSQRRRHKHLRSIRDKTLCHTGTGIKQTCRLTSIQVIFLGNLPSKASHW